MSVLEDKTLEEIGDWIDEQKIPCDCSWRKRRNVILSGKNIRSYDHDGGWSVKGFKERQWVYVHCSACGYDWALWKLIRRAEAVKKHPEMYVTPI